MFYLEIAFFGVVSPGGSLACAFSLSTFTPCQCANGPEPRLICGARGSATAFFSFFINLLLFVSPIYMLQVYDRVLSSRSEPTLVMITLAALIALSVMAVLERFDHVFLCVQVCK